MSIIWKGSPNFDNNRKPITMIVIHWFGMGTLEGASATFQKKPGTSAHYGISDNRVWQWVKEEHVAYHAGNYSVNQKSIGIEHDANPDKKLSEASYQTSGNLVADICKRYNIPLDRKHIIKHSEVPRATRCCGTIDIDKIISIAKGENMSEDEARVSRDHYWKVLDKIAIYLGIKINEEKDVDQIPGLVKNLVGDVFSLKTEISNHEHLIIPESESTDQIETGSKIRKDKDGKILWSEKTYKPAK